MRWLTKEWQNGELSDEEAEARMPAYEDYLNSVADRLPSHVRAFAWPANPQMSIHDALVDRAVIDTTGRRIELILLNGDLQAGYGKLHLWFLEAELTEPGIDRLRALLSDPETEFLYHEVELSEGEPVSFEVRFLLWPEGEIEIRCGDVRADWTTIDDTTRSDHRNEVVVRS